MSHHNESTLVYYHLCSAPTHYLNDVELVYVNTEVLQIVAAALIQNRQNGLSNEYLFIKSDKILGKTLKQD